MEILSPVLSLLSGLLLLFTGRKLFWLAAAVAAFLFTYRLLENLFDPGVIGTVIAGVVGLVFVWLAINFIKTIGLVVGALAGAVGAPALMGLFGLDWPWWVVALIGAVLGIIIVSAAFDWGLILMTAWLGANVVAEDVKAFFTLAAALSGVVFVILLVSGIVVQASQLGKR